MTNRTRSTVSLQTVPVQAKALLPRKGTRFAALRLLGGALLATAALVASTGLAAVAAPAPLFAAPGGTSAVCSVSAPCAFSVAAARVTPGGSIRLATGDYGDQVLRGRAGFGGAQVTIQPQPGAAPRFGRLDTYLPNTRWTGVTATIMLYIRPSATSTVLDRVHLDGAGMFVRSTDVVVRDSLMEGGSSIDGIQVGKSARVRIEGNIVRNYDQGGTSGLHADCMQVFDSSDVTITGNRISNCYNAGIILSPGAKLGLTRVTIESNFIQGCVVVSPDCKGGGSAIDAREPSATDVVVRNNTIVDGSTRVVPLPGLVFDRNIIGYLSSCTAPVTNSIIEGWNRGLCATPSVIGTAGNRTGKVAFVDRPAGDLHLADVDTARIVPVGGKPVAADFDGLTMPADIAGAASGGPVSGTSTRASSADPATPPISKPAVAPTPSSTPTPTPTPSSAPAPLAASPEVSGDATGPTARRAAPAATAGEGDEQFNEGFTVVLRLDRVVADRFLRAIPDAAEVSESDGEVVLVVPLDDFLALLE